jgi:hypothetical protein
MSMHELKAQVDAIEEKIKHEKNAQKKLSLIHEELRLKQSLQNARGSRAASAVEVANHDKYKGGVEVSGPNMLGVGIRQVDVRGNKYVRTTHDAAATALLFANKDADKILLMKAEVAAERTKQKAFEEKHTS